MPNSILPVASLVKVLKTGHDLKKLYYLGRMHSHREEYYLP